VTTDYDAPQAADAAPRMMRGKEIASRPRRIERLTDGVWSVPSQTGPGAYRVWFEGRTGRCTCPDHANRSEACKHIFAVLDLELHASGQALEATPEAPRKQYRQHPAYTKGQTEELRLVDSLLRDLVDQIPDIARTPGRPGPAPTPLRDELYCAILKVYSGLSARRACGVYKNVEDRGLLARTPSFAVSSNLLTRAEVTAILYRLLALSAIPLAGLEEGGVVAPDSTGVQTTSFGGWREAKHGETRVKQWLKVHAIVGTRTHVVIRAVVGDEYSADCPQFAPLLRDSVMGGFRPAAVTADKGYLSKENYDLAGALGIEAFIPFKVNTVSNEVNRIRGVKTSEAWQRAYHLFQANRGEFDRRYHRRSNVESVFSAIKRKFGENIRSRTPAAQVNEVLCKLIAYNLTVVVHEVFENGIAPSFVKTDGSV
jgi:transposase